MLMGINVLLINVMDLLQELKTVSESLLSVGNVSWHENTFLRGYISQQFYLKLHYEHLLVNSE